MCVCVCDLPSSQPIETDESAKKPDQLKLALSSEEEREAIGQLEGAIAADHVSPGERPAPPPAVAAEGGGGGYCSVYNVL